MKKVGLSADKTKLQREAERSTRDEDRCRKENKEDVCMLRGKVRTKEDRDRMRDYYDDASDMPPLERDEESGTDTTAVAGGGGHDGH